MRSPLLSLRATIAAVLAAQLTLAPLARVARADDAETFNFSEVSVSTAAPVLQSGRQNALKARTAPVSSSGTYGDQIGIDLPPGRLGMTPSLGLSYDNGGARRDSAVGAGWSMGVSSISRSTTRGFPPVKRSANVITYEDVNVRFDAPAGTIVATTGGPTGVSGTLYAPQREHSNVRYEYIASTDSWVEHDPSGVKRYFGRSPSGDEARVVNELGTFSWLLTMEVDPYGNHISYGYHGITEQTRADKRTPQRAPILATIQWGGNRTLGIPHAFRVDVTTSPLAGLVDMMHGGIRLDDIVDEIRVGSPSTNYWTYKLTYRTSKDTGRRLLEKVTRTAPGETPDETKFAYSNNDALATRFAPAQVLPGSSSTAFDRAYTSFYRINPQHSDRATSTPRGRHSAYKFLDFDGDGDTDIIYHPAGLQTTSSRVLYDESFLQNTTNGTVGWTQPSVSTTANGYVSQFGQPDELSSELADVDGDLDIDLVDFPVEWSSPSKGSKFGVEYKDVSNFCCSKSFWNHCGYVDPAPPEHIYRREIELQVEREIAITRDILEPKNTTWPTPNAFGSTWPEVDVRDVEPFELGGVPLPSYTPSMQWPWRDTPTFSGDRRLLGCIDLVKSCVNTASSWATCAPFQFTPGNYGAWETSGQGTTIRTYSNNAQNPSRPFLTNHWLATWPSHVKSRIHTEGDAKTGYRAVVDADVMSPTADVNGDGRSDILLLKYTTAGTTKFVPRAFVATAATYEIDSGMALNSRPSQFSGTLLDLLTDGLGECMGDECNRDSLYPVSSSFNSLLADLNADGLPDLLAAAPATNRANPPRICEDGHQLFLNRGYAWQRRTETIVPNETWSAPVSLAAATTSHPFLLLQNRSKRCDKSGTSLYLDDRLPFRSDVLPSATMAMTDLNADGRTDVVFAYSPPSGKGVGSPIHHIWLNNGRGFTQPSSTFVSNYATNALPADFALAIIPPTPFPTNDFAKAAGDRGRFVDLDSDGLVDLVTPGDCLETGGGAYTCTPAKWRRNLGVVPDQLVRKDEGGGSWTTVEYVAATSTAAGATIPVAGRLGLGQQVVSRVVRSDGFSDPEKVTMAYRNFVRDADTSEAIGFEKVTTTFANSFANAPLETVTSEVTYDVRPTLTSTGLLIRHPLKGSPVRAVTTSGTDQQTVTTTYEAAPFDQSARIRERANHTWTCAGSVCAGVGEETLQRDPQGEPLEVISGRSDGTAVIEDNELVRSVRSYTHLTGPVWRLGLLASDEVIGYREGLIGKPEYDATLAHTTWTYDTAGTLKSTTRLDISSAACATGANDETTYTYYPAGVLYQTFRNQRLASQVGYDSDYLHPTSQSTGVTRYVDGKVVGTTKLAETYSTDPRSGRRYNVIDPNLQTHTASLDSKGRTKAIYGPGGQLLEETIFHDAYPSTATVWTYTAKGRVSMAKKHFDGEGRMLGLLEQVGTTISRTELHAHDAFGREVRRWYGRAAASLDDLSTTAGEPVAKLKYDGFDRLTEEVRADGFTSTTYFEPLRQVSANARGLVQTTHFDSRGAVIGVDRFDDALQLVASHTIRRDGLGRIYLVIDADGNERRLERDGGGRLSALEQPHAPGASTPVTTMCWDADDELASVKSPLRDVAVKRDELGRVVKTTATVYGMTPTTTFRSYDDPARLAIGRLARTSDATGIHELGYDTFGRLALQRYEPTPGLITSPSVGSAFEASYQLDWAGHPERVEVTGLPKPFVIDYRLDAKGRVLDVDTTDPLGPVPVLRDVEYDVEDRMTHARFGNATTADWRYGSLDRRLASIHYVDSKGQVFEGITYQYDPNGNITNEARDRYGAMFTSKSQTFDPLDRLETADVTTPLGATSDMHRYSAAGNIKLAAGENYTYGDPRFAQAVTATQKGSDNRSLAYDDEGHVIDDTFTVAGATTSRVLSYDAAGCLQQVDSTRAATANQPASDTTTIYACAHDGRRVVRTTLDNLKGTTAQVLKFAEIAEIRPSDDTFLVRIGVNGTTSMEVALSLTTGERIATRSGYLHSDIRGSVLARTSFEAPGTIFHEEAEYGPWGDTRAVSNQPAPTHGFVDHEPDPDLGYYHFGRRVYDPTLRRWLSPDPLLWGAPDVDETAGEQLNLYAYAANNPVAKIDPSGLAAADVANFIDPYLTAHKELIYESFKDSNAVLKVHAAAQMTVIDVAQGMVDLLRLGEGAGEAVDAANAGENWTAAAHVAKDVARAADLFNLIGGKAAKLVKTPGIPKGAAGNDGPTKAYNRREDYGRTPTKADRKALGAKEGQVVDHDPPLVKRYYEGDPKIGEKPGYKMTPAERKASADDQSRMKLQPRHDSNKQGKEMQTYSMGKKKEHGL